MLELTPRPAKLYPVQFNLYGDFIYTLHVRAHSVAEAEAQVFDLLSSSSFPQWLEKMLPIEDDEITEPN